MIERMNDVLVRIATENGGRRIHQFVVSDGSESLLIDAGDRQIADEVLLPDLRTLGVAPDSLRTVVVTHTDLDHQGGLSRIRSFNPNIRIGCGFEDVPYIEDPELMISDRYGRYAGGDGMRFSEPQIEWIRDVTGPRVRVDLGLVGGELLSVGHVQVRIHHLPGHSAGHLGVEIPDTGDLIIGDAVQGRCCPALDGSQAIPPTYTDVTPYLATIERIRRIGPRTLHSGHDDTLTGSGLESFLQDSADFVGELQALLDSQATTPSTLDRLCETAQDRFGPFATPPFNFVFAIHGHLREMMRDGRLGVVDPFERPLRYVRPLPGKIPAAVAAAR